MLKKLFAVGKYELNAIPFCYIYIFRSVLRTTMPQEYTGAVGGSRIGWIDSYYY
jgi:hypothetical protein